MKKWAILLVITITMLALVGCGGSSSAENEQAQSLSDNYGISTPMTISKNNTDNWIKFEVSDTRANDPSKYAFDLVNAYREHNGEEVGLIWVINYANNTTTCINPQSPIIVTQHDYVKDEQFDCKAIGSGTVLAEYFIDSETGEVIE